MKHSNTVAPKKRNTAGQPGAERARRIEQALGFAHLASLGTGPAKPAPVKPVPALPAVTKRTAVAMPVPTVKAAPTRISFAHLAGDHSGAPLLALVAAPAPATVNTSPKPDPAAIDAQWDQAHRRAASFLPIAQAGRDAVARRWDRLMQSVMGRH